MRVLAVVKVSVCPAPHGAGGLKSEITTVEVDGALSRPARGGWIEITEIQIIIFVHWSRPARGGWIEITVW